MNADANRPRVLLVDDDEGVLRAFVRTFRDRYEITAVSSGPSALEALRGQPFDVVVLDFQMPGMDGAELARRLEAEHPGLPRLMLTGYPGLQEIIDLQEAHLVAAVLVKPWEAGDVTHAVDLALRQAPRPDGAAAPRTGGRT